MILQYGSLIN